MYNNTDYPNYLSPINRTPKNNSVNRSVQLKNKKAALQSNNNPDNG